jgi:hypothetical protein
MKEILNNIALLNLLDYCKANGIDPSGTHIAKHQRKYTYTLLKDTTGKALVTVTYYKHQTPTFIIHK